MTGGSNRTTIELDHSAAEKIDRERFEFCNLLNRALTEQSFDAWIALEPFGVRYVMTKRTDGGKSS